MSHQNENTPASAAAPIAIAQLECFNPSRKYIGTMEPRERGTYVRREDVERRDAARAAAGVPAREQDLLDIVRTLCSTAQRLAELSPAQRANYPSPLSPMSPLLQAASAACVERGYTRWGLEIEGAAYPVPAAQPAPVAADGLLAEVLAVFDLMLVGCNDQNFGDYQNGEGEEIGPRMDALHAKLRAACAGVPSPVAAGVAPAELTDAAIDEVWRGMAGGPGGWLKQFGYRQFARSVASYTLARVAASMAGTILPTDDELWDQTIGQRDHYHDMADKLAEAIAKHCGVDIGEHSSVNCPWHEALDAIASLAPVAAEPVRQVPVAWMDPTAGCVMDAFLWQRDAANPQYSTPVYTAPQVPTAAEVRAAALEEAAQVAEAQNRVGREWVPDSLWDNIIKRVPDAIRALAAAPSVEVKGEQGEMGGGV